MDPKKMPDDVAAKYELVSIPVGTYDCQKFGLVNFEKISVGKADQMVAGKFPHLVLKQTASATDTSAAAPVVAQKPKVVVADPPAGV